MIKSNKRKIRFLKDYTICDYIILIVLILIAIVTLYPFLNVVAISFNESLDTVRGGVGIFPRVFTLSNYKKVLEYPSLPLATLNSVLRTVIGTILNVVCTSAVAYTLSRKDFVARKFINNLFVFTMYVSGGMIPTYLLIKALGLYGNFLVYIIPSLVWAFCVFIMRSYMEGLPFDMQESAMIDGASDLTLFTRVVFPLCKPVTATVALYYSVNHWNSWFDSYLYCLTKDELTTLSYELQKIIQQTSASADPQQSMVDPERLAKLVTPQSIQMAITIVVIVPIILVYPFLQKYFIKGMTIGAVKG